MRSRTPPANACAICRSCRSASKRCSHRDFKAPGWLKRALRGFLKNQRKDRSAAGIIANLDGSMVRAHDLIHDGETEPGALSRTILATPEAIEDVLAIAGRDARTSISHVHG